MENELVRVLEAALLDTDATLTRTEAEAKTLLAEVERLRLERQGLLLALGRHRGAVPFSRRTSGDDGEVNEWLALSRTDAIERVLTRAGDQPLSPTDVADRLAEFGRSDAVHHVGAALSYLRTRNRVRSLGRGRWIVNGDAPTESECEGSTILDALTAFTEGAAFVISGSSPCADDAPQEAAPAYDQEAVG